MFTMLVDTRKYVQVSGFDRLSMFSTWYCLPAGYPQKARGSWAEMLAYCKSAAGGYGFDG